MNPQLQILLAQQRGVIGVLHIPQAQVGGEAVAVIQVPGIPDDGIDVQLVVGGDHPSPVFGFLLSVCFRDHAVVKYPGIQSHFGSDLGGHVHEHELARQFEPEIPGGPGGFFVPNDFQLAVASEKILVPYAQPVVVVVLAAVIHGKDRIDLQCIQRFDLHDIAFGGFRNGVGDIGKVPDVPDLVY